MEEAGGSNLFRYASGRPADGTDSLGLIDLDDPRPWPPGENPFLPPLAPRPRSEASPYPPGDARAGVDFAECYKECMALFLTKAAIVPGPHVPATAASIALYCAAECQAKKQLAGCSNETGGRSPCGSRRKMASFWVDCHVGSEARLEWEECDCDSGNPLSIRGYLGTGAWKTKWRRVTDCIPCVRGEAKPGPRRSPSSFDPGGQVP